MVKLGKNLQKLGLLGQSTLKVGKLVHFSENPEKVVKLGHLGALG